MLSAKEKQARRKKVNALLKPTLPSDTPTPAVLALCQQYCAGETDNEQFTKDYFRLLPDWSAHHWHLRYGEWWLSLPCDEQFRLTNKYGTLRDIALALIKEGALPDLRSEAAKRLE